jgi:ribosomal protein L13E
MKEKTIKIWSKHFKRIRKGSAFTFTDLKRTGLNAMACQKLINLGVSSGSIKELGKEGRFTMYKKINHLSQLSGKKDLSQPKNETTKVESAQKMITVPVEHYKKLTYTVVSLSKQLIELKKETFNIEWLDNVLSGLDGYGIKVK